jgi:hypothetical protein
VLLPDLNQRLDLRETEWYRQSQGTNLVPPIKADQKVGRANALLDGRLRPEGRS